MFNSLQATLSRSQFSVTGASGEISFLPSGDRNPKLQLVQVHPGKTRVFAMILSPLINVLFCLS